MEAILFGSNVFRVSIPLPKLSDSLPAHRHVFVIATYMYEAKITVQGDLSSPKLVPGIYSDEVSIERRSIWH